MSARRAVESHRAGSTGRIMIWQNGEMTQIEANWGLRPFEPGGHSYNLLQAERQQTINPCLIIAHEIGGNTDAGKPYRATLISGAPFICLAGTWAPRQHDWPDAFAALTVPAYPDLAPYKDRHIAVVRQEDWYDWLQGTRPFEGMLTPFPAGSFAVKGPKPTVVGDLFA